jgi:ATP-dependent RNA helicase SUPV3L1/SUV3
VNGQSRIVAVLGPTNTGKTHYAIERMLGHRSGVIGLPLRLLAREVYDRIVGLRGPSVVALVTGEERIVPPRAQFWVCTVEAMPEGMGADFVAIDEIQLCADPERGHVFTDRLLRARGLHETLFLGAETMRGPIAALVPKVQFAHRERMSQLVYTGSKKITRMKPRSAIVGFSVDNVYAIAELIRRQKGGAAVVMGALSPRTRNAQVDLYQSGEVDFLVATDAIGMGLNLDIDHVAFSALSKFDGRRMRPLAANELAQIAGRAGRGMTDGSFGVTGEARPLDEGLAQAIMDNRFMPLKRLNWRNPALEFGSIDRLLAALEVSPEDEHLIRAREADDQQALRALAEMAEIRDRATDGTAVRRLWDVCRIPDFRGISHAEHAALLATIFQHLNDDGAIPDDFIAGQIRRIDRTDGDIDALGRRLAFIRTWTYVAQRKGWLRDESHWRGETRAVEDRVSDALHGALTKRFVDRRTSVLLRRLNQKEALLAEVNDKGEVTVEGEFVGRLEGFRFSPDKTAQGAEAKTLMAAALPALAPHFHLRADRFYNAPDTEIDFTDQGGLMWGDAAIGKLVAGAEAMKPQIEVFVDEVAGPDVAEKVRRRLQHFIDRKVSALFEPLLALSRDEALNGLARGFAFRMVEALGILKRAEVAQEVKDLDQEARGALRKHGLRFGQYTVFLPLLLKPAPTRLRLLLWSLARGLDEFPSAPPPGLVTVPAAVDAPEGYDTMCGYRAAGDRAIRIDMLERLADMLRGCDSRTGFEATADMLSITGMTMDQFAELMQGLGYRAEKAERVKARPAPVVPVASETPEAETSVAPEAETVVAPAAEVAPEPEPAAEAVVDAAPEAAADIPAEAASAEQADAPEAAPKAEAAAEVEHFYTFTWGREHARGRGRPQQGRAGDQRREADRREGGDDKPRSDKPRGDKPRGDKPRGDKPRGDRPRGDKPQGDKPRGRKPGGKDQQDGARTYTAQPPRAKDRIDPDNPFAAALMGLRDRK